MDSLARISVLHFFQWVRRKVGLIQTRAELAMFDSTRLEHEVRPTRRERTCLIGWFHTPVS